MTPFPNLNRSGLDRFRAEEAHFDGWSVNFAQVDGCWTKGSEGVVRLLLPLPPLVRATDNKQKCNEIRHTHTLIIQVNPFLNVKTRFAKQNQFAVNSNRVQYTPERIVLSRQVQRKTSNASDAFCSKCSTF